MSKPKKYPEHEKLRARRAESLTLSGFLDFLDEQKLLLAKYHRHSKGCNGSTPCELGTERLYTFSVPTKEQLIGLYLDIDPKKLSAEKDAMVAEIRAANEKRAA